MAIIKRSTTTIIGLDTELAAVNASIAAEASARKAADGTLASLATTAKGNLVAAINEVKASVDTEASTRQTKIGTLSVNTVTSLAPNATKGNGFGTWGTVNNYTNYDVTGALNILFSAAVTEANERVSLGDNLQQQITNILSNTDATALNSLAELVTAFQTADSNLNNAITTLANTAATNLANEVTARTAADTEIKDALKAYADHVETTSSEMVSTIYRRVSDVSKIIADSTRIFFSVAKVAVVNGLVLEVILEDNRMRLYTTGTASMLLHNFSSIRTIIDGQSYDLSATISDTVYNGQIYPKITVSDLSSTDLAFFNNKTFVVEFSIPESALTYDIRPITYKSEYFNTLALDTSTAEADALKTINPSSTPWGALV